VEYAYDVASQLTGITYKLGANTLGNLTYEYDAAGNRVKTGGTYARTGLPSALASATYDGANQLTQWGAATVTHDANGNLTSDGTNTYTWNARNQLAAMAGPGVNATFQYDAVGRRSAKTLNGSSLAFLYDGLNLVQELSGGVPSANLLSGLEIDEVFSRTDSAGFRSLIADGLGSTLGLFDMPGTPQTEYTYDPFGRTTWTGAASANSCQYTGREDDGTGVYFYRARYYHPGLQRFTGEDPVEFAGGDANLHSYVSNRPTFYIDPLGLTSLIFPRGPVIWGRGGVYWGGRGPYWYPRQGNPGPFRPLPRTTPNPVPRWCPDPRQVPSAKPKPWWIRWWEEWGNDPANDLPIPPFWS
jgi:RHS repeat-associated protein